MDINNASNDLHLFTATGSFGGRYLVSAHSIDDARSLLYEHAAEEDEIHDGTAVDQIPDDTLLDLPDEDKPDVKDERTAKTWAETGRGVIVEPH